jgi:hypothetical protein
MPASSLSGLRGESDPMHIESQIELCVVVEIQRFRPTFREDDFTRLGLQAAGKCFMYIMRAELQMGTYAMRVCIVVLVVMVAYGCSPEVPASER